MTIGQLRDILRNLPASAEVQLLLADVDGQPNYSSASEVRCAQVDYTGDGEVEAVSIVFA